VHPELKKKMSCEVIFLTHNQGQHALNLDINPKAEELIWMPAIQETKQSQFGGINVRYRYPFKGQWIDKFKALQQEVIPWCDIRYIF
jgi:spore photoproduct lyase